MVNERRLFPIKIQRDVFFSVLILINITLRALFHLELHSLCQKLKGYDYLKYNMAAVNSGFVVSCGNS